MFRYTAPLGGWRQCGRNVTPIRGEARAASRLSGNRSESRKTARQDSSPTRGGGRGSAFCTAAMAVQRPHRRLRPIQRCDNMTMLLFDNSRHRLSSLPKCMFWRQRLATIQEVLRNLGNRVFAKPARRIKKRVNKLKKRVKKKIKVWRELAELHSPPVAIIGANLLIGDDRYRLRAVQRERFKATAAVGVPFIQLSTDYVFDGNKRTPYSEDDPIGPVGAYGLTKAEGERAVRNISHRHVILRTAWVYSPYGTNFVRTMLRLAADRAELQIVDDQKGCPTAATDIASTIIAIVEKANQPDFKSWGTYHYCGGDIVTWYGFAARIFEAAAPYGQKAPSLVPIDTAAYPTAARRPPYSVLAMEKLETTFGIKPRPLREGLRGC